MAQQALTGKRVVSVVLPDDIYTRLSTEVETRKREGKKASISGLVVEILSAPTTAGTEQRNTVEISAPQIPEKSGSENTSPLTSEINRRLDDRELAAKTAAIKERFGIKTLATIEEVEPRCDPDSGYIPPEFVAVPDPVSEEDAFRQEFIAEFGRQVFDRAMRIPAFKKMKWPERFEMAREQKERE